MYDTTVDEAEYLRRLSGYCLERQGDVLGVVVCVCEGCEYERSLGLRWEEDIATVAWREARKLLGGDGVVRYIRSGA